MPKNKDYPYEERLGKKGAERYRPGKRMTKVKAHTMGRKIKPGESTHKKKK